MKLMQRLCATAVLTLTLTGSAWAEGVMGTGVNEPDPGAPCAVAQPDPADDTITVEPMIEFIFGLMRNILSLF